MNSEDNTFLTKEDVEQNQIDKYEQSARFIKTLHAKFRGLGYDLAQRKKRAPIRVLEAILFEPLEEIELNGKIEKDLFAICQQIMYHKNKIVEYAIQRKQEAEKEQENESKEV
jgi:hypothetical protein